MNEQVTEYINSTSGERKAIMEKIRSLIHESVKGVTEDFKWSRPVFKAKKLFAYLHANKSNITLGFMNIHKIDDPGGLLAGTGKDMRHIKLETVADIDSVLLKKWFAAAASA
jgi:hypothetical protein